MHMAACQVGNAPASALVNNSTSSSMCSSSASNSCSLADCDAASAQLLLQLPQDLFARGVARFLSLQDKHRMRQASR